MGDFNLDEKMKYHSSYTNRWYYEELITVFEDLELVQLVDFETWSRLINGNWKYSTLDHVYVKDATQIENLQPVE